MQKNRLRNFAGALAVIATLSACDTTSPSQVNTGKIRVKDQMVVEMLDAVRVDSGRVKVIAGDFVRNGSGEMALTVSWLAGDRVRESIAAKQGKVLKEMFRQNGVSSVSVVTVPVTDKKYTNKVVVNYKALTALPPKDCGRIPGYLGSDSVETADQYRYGCETQAILSKMIADPSDLMGKGGAQNNDSRRAGATVEAYKAGTRNPKMEGMQASTVGN